MKAPKIENPLFFKILKEKQIIPDGFVSDLLYELDGNALDVLATLIQSGIGTKRQLCQLWCDSISIAHVDLEKSLFQSNIIRKMPERFARQNYAIPIYQMGDTVTVATPIPDNIALKKQIESILKGPVNLVFALPQDIEWAIENEYQTNTALYEFFTKITTSKVFDADNPISEKTFEEIAGKESINQLHVCLILLGITEYSSEIQIDPEEHIARICFIINGKFYERLQIEKNVYHQLLKNLKALAKITDSNDKDAQYSRIIFPTPGKKFDIQFLMLHTEFGEKIFLKLMDRQALQKIPEISEQFIPAKQMQQLEHQINTLKGIMLISGPSQTDYSSLAYSIINKIRSTHTKKIMTVEDSPTWLLNEIDQYQINPKANFTRSEVLTSCLNLHPDVIYVQNIKDPDIIDDIKKTAENGQFVIAGISAPDVFEAIYLTRLRIGSEITSIINHQNVRRLCDHCKEKYQLSFQQIHDLFIFDGAPKVFAWRAVGCPYCRNTGYLGHIGIIGLLVINDDIRKMICGNATPDEIKIHSKKLGFQSKKYDGIKKVLQGLTSFEEIESVYSS
jgi:type II secretory ATPase GspE/PulE/Tfp pilus assembly ATPase PilB-like protein